MKKWRVGIIGVGGIFNGAHREHYLKDDRLEVVALCDIIEERAVECRDKFFPDAKVYTDFNELLKDETIDSVDICTPNYLHSIIAVAAFKAGKHVFCEKPDAVNVEEVMKMNDAAKAAGKTLMVMRNNRFTDASKLAKKFIDDGRMGEIYCGRCKFADNDVSDSVNSDFGDKVEDGTFDVEDLAMGTIRFDNGAQLQIEFSWASNVKKETRFVELRGTKAGLNWQDGEVEFYTEEYGKCLDVIPTNYATDREHARNLRHFYDVVIEGAEPCFKPQQGIDMIKILCAVYESAKTGREVVL